MAAAMETTALDPAPDRCGGPHNAHSCDARRLLQLPHCGHDDSSHACPGKDRNAAGDARKEKPPA